MGDVFSRAGGPRRHEEALRRPEDAPGALQEAPRSPQEAPGSRIISVLRVFLGSGRGPRMPEDAPGWPPDTCFYVFFLRVAEPPLSSYVFLRVGGSGDAVCRRLAYLSFLAFWWPFGRIIRENTCRERAGRNRLSIESYAL